MELINNNNQRYLSLTKDLILELYKEYPVLAQKKIAELKMLNDPKNPFFKFGQIESFLLLDDNRPVAHASAIIDSRLDDSIGVVGYFEALEDRKYAFGVLEAVRDFLSAKGKNTIRGPINLNTWNSFRLSYPEDNKPFLSEPFFREYYIDIFEEFGFKVVQNNVSHIYKLADSKFALFEDNFNSLEKQSYNFEWIDKNNFKDSLRDIYSIVAGAFVDSWNFTLISAEEFEYFTQNFRELDNNFSCFIKDKQGALVAFAFAFKDAYNEKQSNVVVKTFAISKKHQGKGLGKALFYFLYQKSLENKVDNFIFSTMRDDNLGILNLTGGGDVYRRYKVYELNI